MLVFTQLPKHFIQQLSLSLFSKLLLQLKIFKRMIFEVSINRILKYELSILSYLLFLVCFCFFYVFLNELSVRFVWYFLFIFWFWWLLINDYPRLWLGVWFKQLFRLFCWKPFAFVEKLVFEIQLTWKSIFWYFLRIL